MAETVRCVGVAMTAVKFQPNVMGCEHEGRGFARKVGGGSPADCSRPRNDAAAFLDGHLSPHPFKCGGRANAGEVVPDGL